MTENYELSKYVVNTFTIPEHTNFLNFLKNFGSKTKPQNLPTCDDAIDALSNNNGNISIDSQKCIGCLNCILAQPGELPPLDSQVLASMLFEDSDWRSQELDKIKDSTYIFSGNKKGISMPNIPATGQTFSNFEKFTEVDEVNNVAFWLTVTSKFLSSYKKCRVAKEVQIDTGGDRCDRLDVCAKSNSNVLVLEAKTTFDATIHGSGVNDYRISIPKYMTECHKIVNRYDVECNTNTELFVLLAVGGEETELYPPNDPRRVKGYEEDAKSFYQNLIEYKIQFISANAFWVMALHSILTNRIICWDKLFPKIFSRDGALGLLTSGLVVHKDGKYSVESISELITSSYR